MIRSIASKPLDEAPWRRLQQKNRDRDSKGIALRAKVGKWLLLVVLPAAAILWFFMDAKVW